MDLGGLLGRQSERMYSGMSDAFCIFSMILGGLIMAALIWGTPETINRSIRPPTHPPGYKNIKRKRKP